MITYDDKIKGISESNGRFILPVFKPCDEATFKASYIVASDVKCNGKLTALFDLTVLGNLEAAELDVKGRLVCVGKCEVSGAVTVQNDIWVEDIRAESIETHDRIIAQEIDAGTVNADGNIVVGTILAVEKLAHSAKNILCGETAYGAGKVSANAIITGEPIDLDEGEDAVISPYSYVPTVATTVLAAPAVDFISKGAAEFAQTGNWAAYLDLLAKSAACEEDEAKFKRWGGILSEADSLTQRGFECCKNIGLLIWIAEIANSDYFLDWPMTGSLLTALNRHFARLVHSDKSSVVFRINSYGEWLQALRIMHQFAASMDNAVYDVAFELLVSYLGLKAKFVSERLNEKGWKAHG